MSLLPDSSSLSTYGGIKVDYDSLENPATDYLASQVNGAFADTAAMTRTADRGFIRFTCAATTGGITLISWDANWKGSTATSPVITHVATGHFTAAFPSTVLDETGGSHTINIRSGHGQAEGSTSYQVQVSPSSSLPGIDIYTFTAGGSASDLVGVTVSVYLK